MHLRARTNDQNMNPTQTYLNG